jgi:phosphodiesterase/alkaline phosphatase D-like protein
MNRRDFQGLLVGALAVGAFGTVGSRVASAHVAVDASSKNVYRYRLRYTRKRNSLSFWMRVSNPAQLDSDVPVALSVYADPALTSVVATRHYMARALDSHIVRGQIIDMSPAVWRPGSPLYVGLTIGAEKVTSRLWRLKGA